MVFQVLKSENASTSKQTKWGALLEAAEYCSQTMQRCVKYSTVFQLLFRVSYVDVVLRLPFLTKGFTVLYLKSRTTETTLHCEPKEVFFLFCFLPCDYYFTTHASID